MKNKGGGNTLPDFKTYRISTVIKTDFHSIIDIKINRIENP